MSTPPLGPRAAEQLRRFGRVWNQGEHVLISGGTGSGKTALARHVYQARLDRGGVVVVMVGKLRPDPTILEDYAKADGWVRWTDWHKRRLNPRHRKILLWPDVDKVVQSQAKPIQQEVFHKALDDISLIGRITIGIDEGLYMTNPTFLNMSDDVAMSHAVGRSSNITLITLTQRPSHLPLIVYGSASHAFIGRTREQADAKRLGELGGRESSKELMAKINKNQRHDFTWVPVAPDWPSETINLGR